MCSIPQLDLRNIWASSGAPSENYWLRGPDPIVLVLHSRPFVPRLPHCLYFLLLDYAETTMQPYLTPSFPSTSMSCALIQAVPSASSALPGVACLGNSRCRYHFFDVASQHSTTSSLPLPRLSQFWGLCVFFGLVLWPLGHSLLFTYVPISPLQARVGPHLVHLHDTSTQYGAWHRLGVMNIPWVESNWISSWPEPVGGSISFSLDLGLSLQVKTFSFPSFSQGLEKPVVFFKWSRMFSFHLSICYWCPFLLPAQSLPIVFLCTKRAVGSAWPRSELWTHHY